MNQLDAFPVNCAFLMAAATSLRIVLFQKVNKTMREFDVIMH
jgi:hypothetical protein